MNQSRFHILGEVGRGQFGQVFCGSDRKTGHLVAMKRLDSRRFPTHRFLRELSALVQLNHPHIVNFHALEYTDQGRYLVMDYCQGGTLRRLMESKTQLTLEQQLVIIQDILLGLEHTHQHQIVHCDLKPENILLTISPEGWRAQIADFGIARVEEVSADSGLGDTGSPAYMAPERFYGKYSPQSDIYSVGVLLYELVVGDRPFAGVPLEMMKSHINQPLRLPIFLPMLLKSIIRRSLEKLPQHRYQQATEMRTGIEAVLADIQHRPANATMRTFIPTHEPRRLVFSSSNLQLQQTIPLVIQQMWLRPQGCLMAAASPDGDFQILQYQTELTTLGQIPVKPAHCDVDPAGQWLALCSDRDAQFQLFSLPSVTEALQQSLDCAATQIYFASQRHLLVHVPQGETAQLQLWNRRGHYYWSYPLPVPLQHLIQIDRDRLFALSAQGDPSGFLIDLYPFKVQRLSLSFQADWVSQTRWGYMLVSRQGELLCLNRRGRPMAVGTLSDIEGPLLYAAAEASGVLWIAIQAGSSSQIYTLDVRSQLPKTLLRL